MTKIVPVNPGPPIEENCAACGGTGGTYRKVIDGIDMSLCVNWKECCARLDAQIIKLARTNMGKSYDAWRKTYTHDR